MEKENWNNDFIKMAFNFKINCRRHSYHIYRSYRDGIHNVNALKTFM